MSIRNLKSICLTTIYKRNLLSRLHLEKQIINSTKRHYSKFEPEYLKLLVPDIPEYPLINIQVKGYDFPPLEHYAKYVAKTASHMGIEVKNSWPTPGTVYKINSYTPGSMVTTKEYTLTVYERNVQVANVPSTVMPIFIQLIQNCLPEGVQLSIHPHEQEHEDYRYIPDLEMEELSKLLEEMSQPKK